MTDTVLLSWNDGPAKQAVVEFITSATQPGPDFVEVADRLATFDNDGTLWVEQPLPPQFDFVFRKWAEEIKADPSLADQQPYKAIVEKDPAFFAALAVQDPKAVEPLLSAFARSWRERRRRISTRRYASGFRPSSSQSSTRSTWSSCTRRCWNCSTS